MATCKTCEEKPCKCCDAFIEGKLKNGFCPSCFVYNKELHAEIKDLVKELNKVGDEREELFEIISEKEMKIEQLKIEISQLKKELSK